MLSGFDSLRLTLVVLLGVACSSDPPSFAEQDSSETTRPDAGNVTNGSAAGGSDGTTLDASAAGGGDGNAVDSSATGSSDGTAVDGNTEAGEVTRPEDAEMTDAMVQSPGGDTGTDEDSSVTTESMLELGVPCALASECESGFCVDGVCCESACSEVCSRCDDEGTAGSCTELTWDDACGQQQCPASTECRTYELVDERNCDGIGQCAAEAPCESEDLPQVTSCADGAGTCDGAGDCVIPNKATLGEACATGDECGSGFCAVTASGDSVCCSESCDGVCEACGSDGFCEDAPADDSRCDMLICAADTACADYPDALSQDRCSGFGQCVSAGAHCVAEFADTSTSCGTGMFCDGAGACSDACSADLTWCTSACADLDDDDDNCGACGNQCSAGHGCEQGTCRLQCPGGQVGCDGSCISPNTDQNYCGASGYCEGGNAGQQCSAGQQCIGGACRSPDGATCAAGVDCVSGTCTAWYPDQDGDTFGATAGVVRTCGSNPPGAAWVTNSLDCCDVADDPEDAANVNPNFSTGINGRLGHHYAADGCAVPFDWNCDGTVTKEMNNAAPCSSFTTQATCPVGAFTEGFVPECGVQSIWFGCEWSGGQCQTTAGGPFTQRCY